MKRTLMIMLGVLSIFLLTSCDQVNELKQSTDDLIQQTMDKADEVIKESKEKVRTATDSILNTGSDTKPTEAEPANDPTDEVVEEPEVIEKSEDTQEEVEE